ncbi:MAG TPA: NUDIX domain-containing protein [Dehalococcoidales bacterium]
MDKECRISAGTVIVQQGRILLVRHGAAFHGRDFLVAPGGGVEHDESIIQAVVREVKEETGLEVDPYKILFIEDMISRRKRVIKIWFLCKIVGGQLEKTQNAIEEGIVESKWYCKAELKDEVVYPSILINTDWHIFLKDSWETKYFENKDDDADF